MFKVGDKVKVLRKDSNSSYELDGQIGIIIYINEGHKYVKLDIELPLKNKGSGIHFYELELIENVKEETKMKVNYIVLNDSVVLNFDGKTISVKKEDGRYRDVIQCIKENRLEDIPKVVDIKTFFNTKGFEIKDGLLHIDGAPMPDALSQRVLAFREEGLPFEPLLKFWENLKANPSFNSRTMLYKFLEHNGHPLTEDGCFIAYRGVTKDFKDVHTKTFDNSVGSVCEVPRSSVDDNPNNTCSSGLHVACHEYANGFGSQLIEVKVNPVDVVAVPTDYNGTKMRVCKFEVVSVGEKILTESLYGRQNSLLASIDNLCDYCADYECNNNECMHDQDDEFEELW